MNRLLLISTALLGGLMPLAIDSALKGAVLLLVAGLAALSMRRASAAARHLVWLVAVAALLVVPLLTIALPQWRVLPDWAASPVQTTAAVSEKASVPSPRVVESTALPILREQPVATPAPIPALPSTLPAADGPQAVAREASLPPAPAPGKTRSAWLGFGWLLGILLLSLRLLASQIMLRRAAGSCRTPDEVRDQRLVTLFNEARAQLGVRQRVRLLIDPKRTIPLVWGVFRPRLMVPAEAHEWSDSALRSVLLHELAHLKRRDTLVQWLAQIACALHWWNPLVWLAAWRLHVERERACDDLVLASGVQPSTYAEHLLHVATKLSAARWSSACGLAMARKSSLEGRLVAVLSERPNRRSVTRALVATALLFGTGIAIPVAMLCGADEAWTSPSGAHIGSNDFSAFCVHEGKETAFVIAYHGFTGSSSALDSNPVTRTWTNAGTLITKKSGIELSFHRSHTAPGKVTLTTAPSGPRDLGQPAPAPRDFGQKEYDLAKGRVFLLTDSGLVRQLDIPAPVVTDQESLKKLAALIAAVPASVPASEREEARALHEDWQRLARMNGNIPGALIGELAEKIGRSIHNNPIPETVPMLNAILARLDGTRDWKPAEARALLDELAALESWPVPAEFPRVLQAIRNGEPLPGRYADVTWGDATPDGLRVAWVLEPAAREFRIGTACKARLLVHNSGPLPAMVHVPTLHQGEVKARDGKGGEIDVHSLNMEMWVRFHPCRLGPGEFVEMNWPGVQLGDLAWWPWAGPFVGFYVTGAKPGDELTLKHSPVPLDGTGVRRSGNDALPTGPGWWESYIRSRLARELPLPSDAVERNHLLDRAVLELCATAPTADETAAFVADESPEAFGSLVKRLATRAGVVSFSGHLEPAPVTIRVLAETPVHKAVPRVALSLGDYPLSGKVTLKVRGRASELRFAAPEEALPIPPHPLKLPDAPRTWAIVCRPGEGFFYLLHQGAVRKIDYRDPFHVTDQPASDLPAGFREEVKRMLDLHDYSPQQQAEILEIATAGSQKDGASLKPATERKLKWGPVVNGLRMALAWPPSHGETGMGETEVFHLVVQNVSEAEIRLFAGPAAPNPRRLILRKNGGILSSLGDPTIMPGDWNLKPREVAFLRLFQVREKAPDGRTVDATMEDDIRAFPQYSMTAEMNLDEAPAGAWTGKLVTGESRGSLDVAPPQNEEAQALYKTWMTAARKDGKIPGGVIGQLGESVKTFIKNNPTWETRPGLEKLLPRFDATRDWSGEEAVGLLDELAALQDTPIAMALDQERLGLVQTGTPLPADLSNAPWGKALPNGLRHAWLLEPRAAEQRLGSALKARVLIHNSGKVAVVFRTRSWHQLGHEATDAKGAAINTESTSWLTLGLLQAYRLEPGEFIELAAPGIGVGPAGNHEDWQGKDTRVGTWIEAKAGDEVTVTTAPLPLSDWNENPEADGEPRWWLDHIAARLSRHQPFPADKAARELMLYRVAMELFGTPVSLETNAAFVADTTPGALDALAERLFHRPEIHAWSGPLNSAPTTFRVLPADPETSK